LDKCAVSVFKFSAVVGDRSEIDSGATGISFRAENISILKGFYGDGVKVDRYFVSFIEDGNDNGVLTGEREEKVRIIRDDIIR